MVPTQVANAFEDWLFRRGAEKAGSTWRWLKPHLNEVPSECYRRAYEGYKAAHFQGRDSRECQSHFTRDLHNLSTQADAWVFEPAPRENFPALRLEAKGRTVVITTTDRLLKTPDFGAEATVDSFYKALQARNYSASWQLLSPALQKRVWPKGLEEGFVPGYDTYHGHRFFQKTVVEATEGSATIDVFYEEKQFPPQMSAIHDLSRTCIKDLDSIPAKISGIKAALLELGADPTALKDIPIRRFFEADALIAIPYLVNIRYEVISKACPPNPNAQLFHRARRLYCTKSSTGEWLIERIEPIVQVVLDAPEAQNE